jgi:sulfur carrier protein ThiS
MRVQVKLFSRFREVLPPQARGQATVELPDGATVAHLLDHLGIVQPVRLVSINNQPEGDHGRLLRDGDQVLIFPFVSGG